MEKMEVAQEPEEVVVDPKKVELEKQWKAIVVKAVTNDDYKRELVEDPIKKMTEEGLPLPEGVDFRKTGKDLDVRVQLIPPAQASEELKTYIRWLALRLEMIHEFGQNHQKVGLISAAPGEDEDV
ncbi:MAG: hypothetical protein COV66_06915 [Nitrospinae bacterium CG11_big_fil_rev_8_21_14_0_20_45_15]|nr:MAG: hypothetical protein COV66_06915 [Nitrospinae bacterium CG11_big_fil_rev_8_21_14_0_20_45_15]